MDWLLWLLALPIISRVILFVSNSHRLSKPLDDEQMERETNRAVIFGMAGFSFTGFVGLIAVLAALVQEANRVDTEQQLRLPLACLLASFLLYLIALNLQGYKFYRWLDLVSDFLTDVASLLLIISTAAVVVLIVNDTSLRWMLCSIALVGWFVNHLVRFILGVIVSQKSKPVQTA